MPVIYALLNNKAQSVDDNIEKLLRDYNLVDKQGNLKITIWKTGNMPDKKAKRLAHVLSKPFHEYWINSRINEKFKNNRDSKYNFCIFYHLAMYSFLDLLESKKQLIYNKALFEKVDINDSDISDLILITIKE